MARLLTPDAYHPILQFRFAVEIVDQAPGMKIYGKSTDLPKWTEKDQWKNLIKINCYHFEGITVNELSEINPKNVKLIIKILTPVEEVIYEWRLVGDVIKIDYGHLDRSIDDVTMAEVSFMPETCEIAFDPNQIYTK